MLDKYQTPPQNQDDTFSLAAHVFPVTFFKDKFATEQRCEWLTLPQLADTIQSERGLKKSRLPWLKLATFGDKVSAKGCYRSNANMLELSGVEVEHDAGHMTFLAAVEILAQRQIRCLAYTSPSFVPDEKEKWRILAPLSVTMKPTDRMQLAARLNGVLAGKVAPESFNLSQAYLYGAVNGNVHHRAIMIDGDLLDMCDDLDAGAIGKPIAPRSARVNNYADAGVAWGRDEGEIRGLLEKSAIIGEWHNSMLSVTATMVGAGWSDEQIELVCKPYAPDGMADVWTLVKSAREKWHAPDPGTDWGSSLGPMLKAAGQIAGAVAPPSAPNWRDRVRGAPKADSMDNTTAAILANSIAVSEDVFHHQVWIGRSDAASPNEPLLPFMGQLTDANVLIFRRWLDIRYGLDFGNKNVRDAVMALAHANRFDPVLEMLAEAEANWDGVERLDRMAVDFFNCADTPLNRQMVRKTMIAAVARARVPGIKFDTILTTESPEGWNKSSAWAVLAGEGNFSDQSILGAAGREVMEQLGGKWIHENSELAGITRPEVETIKAFASRQIDRARPAYGHFVIEQPRRSIEVATTNENVYLLSATGNRRFWPLQLQAEIDLDRLRRYRLQLWGEAARWQSQGENLTLDRELWNAAGIEQEARRVMHPWEPILANMMAVPAGSLRGIGYIDNAVIHVNENEGRVATWAIFQHVLKIPNGQLHNGHTKTLVQCMRRQGWEPYVFELNNKTTRGYRVTDFTALTGKGVGTRLSRKI